MPSYLYDQNGVASDLEFGKLGGRVVWNVDHFEITTNGSTPAQIRVPTTPINVNDAASKSYVDATALQVQEQSVAVANNINTLNFEGSTFNVTSNGAGQVTVQGVRVPMSIINEPNDTRTAQLGDDCNYVVMATAVPGAYIVPPDATLNFPIGAVLTIEQGGPNQLTIIGLPGVVINSAAQFTARAQFGVVMLVKKAANLWTLTGDLTV